MAELSISLPYYTWRWTEDLFTNSNWTDNIIIGPPNSIFSNLKVVAKNESCIGSNKEKDNLQVCV